MGGRPVPGRPSLAPRCARGPGWPRRGR
jgi:hypothetical protein